MKFIFISGGVISGIGKGTATASIALLLKSAGFKVSPIKCDPYLNVDAGTMNPIVHGEVFVLDDGAETDEDLGHYERFLNENLTRANYTTSGQVYKTVIEKERQLLYDGGCVEAVPHIPEEIIRRIVEAGKARSAEIVLIEVGGTVGEYQNMLYFEANRMLKQKFPEDVAHIHITYLPIPSFLGEMKSKPAQMSVHMLNSYGIQPDFILARAERPIDKLRKQKLSVFCGIPEDSIIAAPDVSFIYEIPLNFEKEKLTDKILEKLKLKRKKRDLKVWRGWVEKAKETKRPVKVGIVGKYFTTGDFSLTDSYISVIEAIKHAAVKSFLKPEISWLDAGKIEKDGKILSQFDGIIVPGGFGPRDIEGKIAAIRFARESKVPYLGLCFGMQLAVVEYARNVLGLAKANSTEISPSTPYPVIHVMPEQEKKLLIRDYGGTMRLGGWSCIVKKGTKAFAAYRKRQIHERHRHRFEFNNKFLKKFNKNGLIVSGTTADGKLVEIIELANHPFFVGTQFHPELKSKPLSPAPLFVKFLQASASRRLLLNSKQ